VVGATGSKSLCAAICGVNWKMSYECRWKSGGNGFCDGRCLCSGDDDVYGDDEGGDDDTEESSGGSGYVDRDMAPRHRVDSRESRRRYHPHQLPPVPVDPRFNPHAGDRHYVDPSLLLPAQRPSTRRRPVMYTAVSVVGPAVYTTPGDVYFTPRRTNVGNKASLPSRVVSSMFLVAVVTVSRLVDVRITLSDVS